MIAPDVSLPELMLTINLTVMMIISVLGFVYITRELRAIHGMMNSRLTELLNATRTIAHAAGVAEGHGQSSKQ